MSEAAVVSLRMQFCAGPETYVFYACHEHRPLLEKGDVSCFLKFVNEPIQPVDPDDEESCYFCQEG